MNAFRLKNVIVYGLLVALILAPARRASAAGATPDPFEVIPEDCVACLRINNFEYNISQVDQFLVGLSPMPLGLTAIVRGMLGGILGDPQLAGVNMNGTFGGFILAMPGAADPNEQMFGGLLVPVTDYAAFLAAVNVGQPDAAGVSRIVPKNMIPPMPPVAVKKVGAFALVTWIEAADMLVTVADSMSSPNSRPVATRSEVAASDIANAPIWMYLDIAKAATLAPAAGAQVPPGAMPPGAPFGTPGAETSPADFGAMPMAPGMMPFDLASMAGQSPVKSLILGLVPKPNSMTVMARLSAVPGSELEPVFTRGSAEMQGLLSFVGAKTPAQMGSEMAAVSALLPNANTADAVGTYDLMQLTALADVMPIPIPVEFPEPTAPSKSAVAYAVTADKGRLAADIAFPKEHIIEVAGYLKQALANGMTPATTPPDTDTVVMQGGLGGLFGDAADDTGITISQDSQIETAVTESDEPKDDISMITASPFGDLPSGADKPSPRVVPSDTIFPSNTIQVEPKETAIPTMGGGTSLFGDTDTGLTGTTTALAPAPSGARQVRVAGVRLVRYSDMNMGVLPLGRGDGYTLSLIADLPAQAAKIAGGVVEKAITSDGKDLAPKNEWDRQVRFTRLSKDYKTAIFDIELLLPDPGAMGIEELTGSLDYFTASGTKDVDLGLLEMKAGAQASQLGAKISSIDINPFRTSGPIIALTLNVPADSVESIELYDEQDKRVEIMRYSSVSLGRTSTLKFFVEDDLPARARIVVHIFEGLQKHNLPFTIRAISIAGLPMR